LIRGRGATKRKYRLIVAAERELRKRRGPLGRPEYLIGLPPIWKHVFVPKRLRKTHRDLGRKGKT